MTLDIRKKQLNDEERQKIDTQIETVKKYNSYWHHYSRLIDDFEDELKFKIILSIRTFWNYIRCLL